MGYRMVAEGLGTGWDDQPRMAVENSSNRSTRVTLHYVTHPEEGDEPPRSTSITFEDVVLYRWIDVDLGYEPDNREDGEFTLIEVTDSELVADILARGRWQNEGPERDLARLFGTEGLLHFRIMFDDHGTYDVVCHTVTVRPDNRCHLDSEGFAAAAVSPVPGSAARQQRDSPGRG